MKYAYMNKETASYFLSKLPSVDKSVQSYWSGIEIIGLDNQYIHTVFMSDKRLTKEECENINDLIEEQNEKKQGLTKKIDIPTHLRTYPLGIEDTFPIHN